MRVIIAFFIAILTGCVSTTYIKSLDQVDQKMRDPICWDIYFKDPLYTYTFSRCNLTLDTIIKVTCFNSMKYTKGLYTFGPENYAFGKRGDESIVVKSQSVSSDEFGNGICKNNIGYDYQVIKPGGIDIYLFFIHMRKYEDFYVIDRSAQLFEWEKIKKYR